MGEEQKSRTYETFLDYNKSINVVFTVVDEAVSFDYECDVENKGIAEIIKRNLKGISHLEPTDDPNVYTLNIRDTIFVDINIKTGEIVNVNKLTTFETRSLAQGRSHNVPFSREGKPDFRPETDLHTHLAGAIRSDSLIEVGLKHNIDYPKWALEKMGIDVSKYEFDEKGNIKLQNISPEDLEMMKNKMQISPVTQERFGDMENVYVYRGPFTKNIELFPDYLWELARDYQEHGQKYVELSFSSIINDKKYMEIVEAELPKIEAATGVKIRFLIGLWRHSDKEWNQDEADRLMGVAESKYVVGVDFMGHETNQTLDFEGEIRTLARYAMEKDPNFVIRVHAGENPIFKTNVYDALKIIQEEHDLYEAEHPDKKPVPIPQIRIGHGLYGMDIDTDGKWRPVEPGGVIKLIKELGAVVEFNMSSNLALNNINGIEEVPIKQYIDAGVRVVLGTDGHGLYSTNGDQEVLLAKAAGLTLEDFEKIKETEELIQEKARQREEAHPKIEDIDRVYKFVYSTADGNPRWNSELAAQKKEKLRQKVEFVKSKIIETGAITDKGRIEEDTKGKIPFVISSASKSSWGKISEESKEAIAVATQVLADCIDPDKAYIVTGGTNFGGEKTMHEAVRRRNAELPLDKQIVLLGTFTLEAAKDPQGIEPETITHGMLMELDGKTAPGWMQLPDTQLEYAVEHGGCLIAMGGGAIVSDMIQRSHNNAIPMHLMDGPEGASTDKAHSFEGNDYAFASPQELIRRLYERYPEAFGPDFDLDKLDEIVARARRQLGLERSSVITLRTTKDATEKDISSREGKNNPSDDYFGDK